jgi:hypothetical protein
MTVCQPNEAKLKELYIKNVPAVLSAGENLVFPAVISGIAQSGEPGKESAYDAKHKTNRRNSEKEQRTALTRNYFPSEGHHGDDSHEQGHESAHSEKIAECDHRFSGKAFFIHSVDSGTKNRKHGITPFL